MRPPERSEFNALSQPEKNLLIKSKCSPILATILLLSYNPVWGQTHKFDKNSLQIHTSYNDESTRFIGDEDQYNRKSPAIAFALGFGPGFFIHGLGHYYIGKPKTGNAMFALEIVSTAVIVYAGPHTLFAGWDNPGKKNAPGMSFLFAAGLITFTGTWVYDFTAAPYKAIQLNKKHGFSMRLYPEVKGDMTSVFVILEFR